MREYLSLRITKWMLLILTCVCLGQSILATPSLTAVVEDQTATTIHGTRAFTVSVNNTINPVMTGAIQAAPVVYWFSPSKVPLGNTTFTVNGANFVSGAVAYLDGVALPTTFVSATQLKVTSNFTQSGSGKLTVINPGGLTSSPRLLEYGQGIVVTISPNSVTVATGATQQFTATVTGTANTKVYWYVNGGSANGTISSSGLYKAPASAPASPVTIRAVCEVNSERSASATVTVTGAPQTVAVNISPSSASVQTSATQQFNATVTGSANTAVTWQVNNVTGGNATVGTISNTGLYTAPATVPAGSVTVRAVSQADTTKSAVASVTVTEPPIPVVINISPTSASLPVNATQQ
ncbi:MAG TPA: Ig-like domain-containing protein, partial [Blastocatellia bacterium]|nr:Ig-like domain-containing protein [Blastocatellia bacterium]